MNKTHQQINETNSKLDNEKKRLSSGLFGSSDYRGIHHNRSLTSIQYNQNAYNNNNKSSCSGKNFQIGKGLFNEDSNKNKELYSISVYIYSYIFFC